MTQRLGVLILMAGFGAALLPAQQPPMENEAPGRAVARISVANGEVSLRRGDAGEVVAAAVNSPMEVQDELMTGPSGVAEVQFDAANLMRLGVNADVRLSDLQYGRYQLQIAHGPTAFRVMGREQASVELATPSVSVHPLAPGFYRVDVLDDGTTQFTVRAGEADVFTPQGSVRVRAGQSLFARGDPSNPEYQIAAALPPDQFEQWNQSRDQQLAQSVSYRYVSPDIVGAQDLDAYGRWIPDQQYGEVWTPQVGPDWAPYRDGQWSWTDYYGWTWVDYEPWGWAPFHYGRWFNRPGIGWCWFPGAIGPRHYWSPGLVAFFGFGGGGVDVSFGNVGWVPLAPFEAYHPWYGSGYYRSYRGGGFGGTSLVNVNILNTYRNARYNNSITTLAAGQFGRGGRGMPLGAGNYGALQQASLVRGQLPFAPSRESLAFSRRAPAFVPQTSRFQSNPRFFSRQAPANVERVPFAQQQQHMQQLAQRTFGASPRGGFGGAPNGAGTAMPGNPGAGGRFGNAPNPSIPNSGPWRSAERPMMPAPGAMNPAPNARTMPNSGNGWRRFGSPMPSGQGYSSPPNNPSFYRNDRPPMAQPSAPAMRGYGSGGGFNGSSAPAYQAPRPQHYQAPQYQAPQSGSFGRPAPAMRYQGSPYAGFGAPSGQVHLNPPIVQQAPSYSRPSYSLPPQNYSRPAYSAPQNVPRPNYSAPQNYSRPSYSPPPQNYSRPSYSPPPQNYSRPNFSAPPQNYSRPSYNPPPQFHGGSSPTPQFHSNGGNNGGGDHSNHHR